ncbi:O-antigen ligase family protein [bacterium]|nr:O-antigen ligase family protein [bacterium]
MRQHLPRLTEERFGTLGHYLLATLSVVTPLSIAAIDTCLVILTLAWLGFLCSTGRLKSPARVLQQNPVIASIATPMLVWFLFSTIATCIGLGSMNSVFELVKVAIYLSVPFVVYQILSAPDIKPQELLGRISFYCCLLLIGQALAALHSVIELSFPELLLSKSALKPPGPVTEAGQVLLVFGALIFLLLLTRFEQRKLERRPVIGLGIGLYCAVTGLVCAWAHLLNIPALPRAVKLIFILSILVIFAYTSYKGLAAFRAFDFAKYSNPWFQRFIITAGSLIALALLINLKRGPWLGVFILIMLVSFAVSRRLGIGALLTSLLVLVAFNPVQDRLFQVSDHFSIAGGRKSMWSLGLEIIQRYPLGLGVRNAKFMRELDPTLPEAHRHLHNNILNIAAESGIMGSLVFIWWMFAIFKLGFSGFSKLRNMDDQTAKSLALCLLALTATLVGWQVAGLAEYNYGDGEVRMIAFYYLGYILAITSIYSRHEKQV